MNATARLLVVTAALWIGEGRAMSAQGAFWNPPNSEGTVTGHHTRSGDTLTYSWTCLTPRGEQEMGFTMCVGNWAEMERSYGRLSHKTTKKWEKRFIFDDPFCYYLHSLAGWLNQIAAQNGISVVGVALSFVQSFPHSEWDGQRYAIETLVDQTGDCGDKSMLLGGIFWALGLDYVIIDLPGHLALGVWSTPPVGVYYVSQGRAYSYCETNGGLRPVGYCPSEFERARAGIRHPAWQ